MRGEREVAAEESKYGHFQDKAKVWWEKGLGQGSESLFSGNSLH